MADKIKYPNPYSLAAIESRANGLRRLLGFENETYFNIADAAENRLSRKLPNFFVQVLTHKEMSKIEAYTEYEPARISIREDFYEGACRDDVRSRFALAHEFGHLSLHWGYPRPRAPVGYVGPRQKAERRVEKEANIFAGMFLMPTEVAMRLQNDRLALARTCRVSEEAAAHRLHLLLIQSDRTPMGNIRRVFGEPSAS